MLMSPDQPIATQALPLEMSSIIVELNTSESELARGWIEGEGWLSRLLPLRAEILKGDYRSLYLFRCWADEQLAAWWDEEEDGPMSPLPPAPSGLGRLSMAQQALVDWLDIDEAIIARARAHRAEAAVDASYDYDALIRALPREESDAFLRRLLDDEPLLSAALRQRLRRGQPQPDGQQRLHLRGVELLRPEHRRLPLPLGLRRPLIMSSRTCELSAAGR